MTIFFSVIKQELIFIVENIYYFWEILPPLINNIRNIADNENYLLINYLLGIVKRN